MKLIIACLACLVLLFCLPAAAPACPPATQAVFGAGYGDSCAAPVGAVGYGMPVVAQAPAYGVSMNFGAGGYGAMAAPVALAPVRSYGMVRSFGAAAPLYGGFSGAAFVAPARQFVAVPVPTRPGLLGRLRAARQGFRRGF